MVISLAYSSSFQYVRPCLTCFMWHHINPESSKLAIPSRPSLVRGVVGTRKVCWVAEEVRRAGLRCFDIGDIAPVIQSATCNSPKVGAQKKSTESLLHLWHQEDRPRPYVILLLYRVNNIQIALWLVLNLAINKEQRVEMVLTPESSSVVQSKYCKYTTAVDPSAGCNTSLTLCYKSAILNKETVNVVINGIALVGVTRDTYIS